MIQILRINSELHLQTIEYNDLSSIHDKNNYSLDFEGVSDHASSFDS